MKLIKFTLWDAAFVALVIALIAFKIPHLYLPYFWDESWSYAPALQLMCEKGVSLMPGAIPAENYRGHPTLYYALGGLWLKIFGVSRLSMHSFSMAFSVAALATIYAFGRRFFTPFIGLSAVILLIGQGYFLTQCSMVLPEMAVMFWGLLAFYFFFQNKWWAYFFAASALMMTKESGLALIGALLLGWFIECLIKPKSTSFGDWFFNSCRIAAPLLPFIAFFCIQNAKMGWFFFPEHVGYMTLDPKTIVNQNIPIVFDVMFLHDEKHVVRGVFFIALILVIGAAIWQRNSTKLKDLLINRIFGYFTLFMTVYIVFCAMNFFTPRYVLWCLPMFTLMTAKTLYESVFRNKWATLFVASCVGIHLFQWTLQQTGNYGDTGWGMYDALKVQDTTVRWFEKNTPYSTHIGAADFLVVKHLKDPKTGFLTTQDSFPHTAWDITSETEYVVDTKIAFDNRIEPMLKQGKMTLIQHYKVGEFWADIYKVKK
jgi:hypothetical protein